MENYDELVKELRSGCGLPVLQDKMDRAAAAIEELQKRVQSWQEEACKWNNEYYALHDSISRWASVKDAMPKECEDVLLLFEHNQAVGFWTGIGWSINNGDDSYMPIDFAEPYPTHWMPLPSTEGLNG